MTEMLKRRVESLRTTLRKKGLDGLLVKKDENIRYLSGYNAQDSARLIITHRRNVLVTDARFKEAAEKKAREFDLKITDRSLYNALKEALKKEKVKSLGFESDHTCYTSYFGLKTNLKKTTLLPTRWLIESLRAVKDDGEISLIKKAVSITQKACLHAKKTIKPAMTGSDLAAAIDNKMRLNGALSPAFRTIVAQNPYSSHPHAEPTEKAFGKNSAVVVDTGAVYKWYNSDLTRMLFLGTISTKFKHIYNILKAAQQKAIDIIAPGIKISAIDRAARQYIASKGYGSNFLHGLGHGIGLEIHEGPNISSTSKRVLLPGMVFTVEPGIYIPGWGGLRVEDMVLVTKNGCEVLTNDIPK